MLIEVFGPANERSAALETALEEALAGLAPGVPVTVRRVEDPGPMIARGVRQPPALAVDGKVVCRGRVPTATEVRELLVVAGAQSLPSSGAPVSRGRGAGTS